MNSYTQERLKSDEKPFHAVGLLRLCWYMDATGGTLEDLFGSDCKYADYQPRLPNPEKTGERFEEFCQRIDQWCDRQWDTYEQQLSNCGYCYSDGRTINTLSAFKEIIKALPWTDRYMLVENKPSKLLYDYKTVDKSRERANLLATTGHFAEWCQAHCMKETLEFVWIEQQMEHRPAPCLRRTLRKLLPNPSYGSKNTYPVEIIEEKIQWECLVHYY
jgi:hypothetical protein